MIVMGCKVIIYILVFHLVTSVTSDSRDDKLDSLTRHSTHRKPSDGSGQVRVEVVSGMEEARITTNFTTLRYTATSPSNPSSSHTNYTNLGLYVTIIHQVTGQVMGGSEHFQPWSDLRRLGTFLDMVQPGRVLVLMLRGDFSYGLPETVRATLGHHGSLMSVRGVLGRGAAWVWVWVKGGTTLGEALASPTRVGGLGRVRMVTWLKLNNQAKRCRDWPSSDQWEARRKFCEHYERYGDLCSCDSPYPLNRNLTTPIPNNQIEKAAIFIIAHRAPAFYRSFKTLVSSPGFDSRRVEVFTAHPHSELSSLLALLSLRLTVTQVTGTYVSSHITRQFAFAFKYVLKKYEDADFVIVLEEDIFVSPDFFLYLNSTASLLKRDPSLHCVSAHNDLSYPATARDPTVIIRAASYTNYGWMIRRDFAKEMAEGLPGGEVEASWDVYTYFFLRRGRECVIPEISRSYHFGDGGTNINQFTAHLYFAHKHYNQDNTALVQGVDQLEKGKYEEIITSMLERAIVINPEIHSPCSEHFNTVLLAKENDVLVLFFHAEGDTDLFRSNAEWSTLASCLGTFGLESRESHHGLYRLRYGPAHLLLVAYPASLYRYKPKDAVVFRATPETREVAFRKAEGRLRQEPYSIGPPQDTYRFMAARPLPP